MRPGEGWAALPLHVETLGEGPPVLLVHGYGASAHSFRHWTPELARDHRVILVDLKGHGAAPKPREGRYSPVDLAEPLARLVVAMDLRDLTLLGHSLGGGVVLVTALRLLDAGEWGRLRGLVSVAGAAYEQGLPAFASLALRPRLSTLVLGAVPKTWLVRRVLRSIVHDPGGIDRAQVTGYAAPLRDPGTRRALVTAAGQLVPPELDRITARYPELNLPTLLLWGRQDPVVPLSVAERLDRALPRSRLVVLEACGHLPAEERPAESLRALRDFLAGR